jgi:hypothetical protein
VIDRVPACAKATVGIAVMPTSTVAALAAPSISLFITTSFHRFSGQDPAEVP